MDIKPGEKFEIVFPFVRVVANLFDCDGPYQEESWKPGVEIDDDDVATCDAEGKAIYTVVSTHKPGKFPERVFYTRSWIDPDGKAFGKSKLRMTTKAAFKRLCKGYRHEYDIID